MGVDSTGAATRVPARGRPPRASGPAISGQRPREPALARGRGRRARRRLVRDRPLAGQRPGGRRGGPCARVDIRDRSAVEELLAEAQPERVLLLAAQASRPISYREPDRTEEINILGTRRVAEAVAHQPQPRPAIVFGSSLHVYGPGLEGEVGPEHPYGPQGDLAHLSKIYGELSLRMHAERHGFDARAHAARDRLRPVARRACRAGVADRRRQVPQARGAGASRSRSTAAGRRPSGSCTSTTPRASSWPRAPRAWRPHNVVAETSRSPTSPRWPRAASRAGGAGWTFSTAVPLRAPRRGIPARVRLLVTGATGYLGWRTRALLEGPRARRRHAHPPGQRPRAASAGPAHRPPSSTPATPRRATLVDGCDAVLHFAGVPDPARARQDPATAVRENVGTTVNLLEACAEHDALLVLPVHRPRRARPAARSLRPLQAPRRGGLPAAPRTRRRAAADVRVRPRPGRLGGSDRARSPRSRPAPSTGARSRFPAIRTARATSCTSTTSSTGSSDSSPTARARRSSGPAAASPRRCCEAAELDDRRRGRGRADRAARRRAARPARATPTPCRRPTHD